MVWSRLIPQRGHPSLERLSEYVDGRGREEMEGHLASCAVCQEEIASLTATREYLSGLREVAVPRSFYPMVGVAGRQSAALRDGAGWPWFGLLPGLRMATAAVATMLVLAVGLESYAAMPGPAIARYAPAPTLGQSDAANKAQEAAPAVPALRDSQEQSLPGAAAGAPVQRSTGARAPTATGDADRGVGGPYVMRGIGSPPGPGAPAQGAGPASISPPSGGMGVRPGPVSAALTVAFVLLVGLLVGLERARRAERNI